MPTLELVSMAERLAVTPRDSDLFAKHALLLLMAERLTELHNAIESTLDSCVYEDQLPWLREISEKFKAADLAKTGEQ